MPTTDDVTPGEITREQWDRIYFRRFGFGLRFRFGSRRRRCIWPLVLNDETRKFSNGLIAYNVLSRSKMEAEKTIKENSIWDGTLFLDSLVK